ncbi:MAG: NAD(P)-dependent oxidoreductase [Rhodobacterales bacterium]
MARVLLTGATGFVGRHILQRLEAQGHSVLLPVRPNWQDRISIHESLTQTLETKDLFAESFNWWYDTLDGIDTVIHAAWYAEPGVYLTSEKNLDCLSGTLQLAKAASARKLKRFIGLGSCIEYDLSENPLTLDTPLAPTTPYSAAKVAAFHTLRQWFAHEGVSFLWCRLFYLYGTGENPKRLVPYLHEKLKNGEVADLSSGTQIRDFIDVEKAADMIVDGAFSQAEGAANICTGQGQTVRELAENIADQYGRRDLLNFGARPDNLVDPPCIIGAPTVFKR